MKRANKSSNFLSVLMVFVIIFTMATTATATTAHAASNDPYTYVWQDASNVVHYQYYQYSKSESSYIIGRRVISIGSAVFDSDGNQLYSNVQTGKSYIGYSTVGDLYVVTEGGNLEVLSYSGVKTTYTNHKFKSLVLDYDDLVVAVKTSNGAEIKLSKLGTGTTTPAPTITNKGDKVERYGAEAQTIKAYDDGVLKLQLYIEKATVTEKMANVILSEACKGAKFLGVDKSYNVYLYETTGTLYRFCFGKWYTPEILELDGTVKSYKEDKNGFVTSITTDKKTYSLEEIEEGFDRTYSVRKHAYETLYIEGSDDTHVLQLTEKKLYLDDKLVCYDPIDFGFVDEQTMIIVYENSVAYTMSLTFEDAKWQRNKVTELVRSDENGLVTHVKCGEKVYNLK